MICGWQKGLPRQHHSCSRSLNTCWTCTWSQIKHITSETRYKQIIVTSFLSRRTYIEDQHIAGIGTHVSSLRATEKRIMETEDLSHLSVIMPALWIRLRWIALHTENSKYQITDDLFGNLKQNVQNAENQGTQLYGSLTRNWVYIKSFLWQVNLPLRENAVKGQITVHFIGNWDKNLRNTANQGVPL